VLDLRVVAEIDKQTKLHTGRLQIVDHLSPVLVSQLLDRLDFEDDFTVAHKVRLILLLQRPPFVLESKSRLFLEWNLLLVQLSSQTLLIYRFQKAVSLLFVDLETSTDDSKALLLRTGFSRV